jgi:NitT/TauT family transport system substrate-binding protein
MVRGKVACLFSFSVLAVAAAVHPAQAQGADKVKVAASFVGLWDTSQATFCKERGEFAKAGLEVEVVSTRGGSETVQAVIAGGMDIGYSPGTNAVIAANIKGAPIKIISSEFVGQNDTFMYVRTDSPIREIKDLNGKSVSFPRPGGASEAMLLALRREQNLDFKLVATGGLDATFTMVMTGQVDVGYSFPPYGLDRAEKGDIRILFAGDAAQSTRNISARVNVAQSGFVKSRRPVASKFMAVLDGCIDWMYAHRDEATKMFATLNKVSPEVARRSIEFYDRATLAFAPIKGFDESVQQAIEGKFIDSRPTEAQLRDMIDIVYSKN